MSLGHFRNPSSLDDPYSSQPYLTNSAMGSVQDFRDRALGTSGGRYSPLSTSDDFNPYSEPRMPRANFAGSASATASAAGSSSGPPTHAGRYLRRPEKGPIPTEASSSSSRLPRQEVDAGRVPVAPDQEEETLPPNYDPTWAS